MSSRDERDALITHLKRRNIQAIFHYSPLHLSAMGRKFGAQPDDAPIAASMGDRIVRLPFFTSMTQAEQTRVIDGVRSF
jgi:dTDP-4-amino-4,6-dideoxygalactose transaminase